MNETIPVVWSLCKIMPAYKKVSNLIINVITKPPIPAISQVTGSIGVSRIVLLITIVKHVKANANNDIDADVDIDNDIAIDTDLVHQCSINNDTGVNAGTGTNTDTNIDTDTDIDTDTHTDSDTYTDNFSFF